MLLSKRKQRARNVDVDYVGFEIDDEFVVGYGLDFMERYRNLPVHGGVLSEGTAGGPAINSAVMLSDAKRLRYFVL